LPCRIGGGQRGQLEVLQLRRGPSGGEHRLARKRRRWNSNVARRGSVGKLWGGRHLWRVRGGGSAQFATPIARREARSIQPDTSRPHDSGPAPRHSPDSLLTRYSCRPAAVAALCVTQWLPLALSEHGYAVGGLRQGKASPCIARRKTWCKPSTVDGPLSADQGE
jgi:hypothetical protein